MTTLLRKYANADDIVLADIDSWIGQDIKPKFCFNVRIKDDIDADDAYVVLIL